MIMPTIAGVLVLAQVTVPRPAPPYMPPAYAPGSQPNMLISPPPASWQGQWRPEYGTMVAPPWTQKP